MPSLLKQLSIDEYINTYAQTLNKLPVKMVWFDPASGYTRYSCSELFQFVSGLQKKINFPIGIRASRSNWQF